ncbi:protein TBATA isoform 2-T2 [Synchiropus picturatus]
MSDRRSTSNFCGTTEVSSISRKIQSLISPALCSTDPRTPRLGGHYLFFSRHNPHPHRVRHIQGLNGRPVCMVRDDWNLTSTLFPHPLLKSQHHGRANEICLPANHGHQNRSGWRGELQEIAAKVAHMKLNTQTQPAGEEVRLKTQYSSQTGRIIPPSTRVSQRRSYSQPVEYRQQFQDPEVTVLEVLRQILQTDSFSAVQQWLLLASPREKEQVMAMIKDTIRNGDPAGQRNSRVRKFDISRADVLLSKGHSRGMKSRVNGAFDKGGPERIGNAEVLSIHKDHFHEEL